MSVEYGVNAAFQVSIDFKSEAENPMLSHSEERVPTGFFVHANVVWRGGRLKAKRQA